MMIVSLDMLSSAGACNEGAVYVGTVGNNVDELSVHELTEVVVVVMTVAVCADDDDAPADNDDDEEDDDDSDENE